MTSATLECGDTSDALGLGKLQPGVQVHLDGVPEACLTAFPTFLSFTHRGDRAVISPLLLCQGCG